MDITLTEPTDVPCLAIKFCSVNKNESPSFFPAHRLNPKYCYVAVTLTDILVSCIWNEGENPFLKPGALYGANWSTVMDLTLMIMD